MNESAKIKFPFEYKLPIIYIVLGSLWILFSDQLVLKITSDPKQISLISIYKGWSYVLITGILLYLFIKKEIKKERILFNKLLEANKKAMESDRLKSAFLSNISHYIRTPMNSILGFVELLEYRNLDSEKREQFHAVIDEQSQHLLQLINNIIEIAKMQEGQISALECEFSMNDLLRKLQISNEILVSKMKPGLKLNHIAELTDHHDRIFSDYGKLHHVFSNLINNAIKFTTFGEIEFGYHLKTSHIECFVRDTGCGIPVDKIEDLTNRFMQSNPIIQDVNEGSGLGLFLSAGLIKALGGKLWIEYTSEKGTKLNFTIPYKKAHA